MAFLFAGEASVAYFAAYMPANRPKTTNSANELEPRRFAPCKPTDEHSPTANRPLIDVSHF